MRNFLGRTKLSFAHKKVKVSGAYRRFHVRESFRPVHRSSICAFLNVNVPYIGASSVVSFASILQSHCGQKSTGTKGTVESD